MRYVVLGLCIVASAWIAVTQAKGNAAVPFKGNLQATETVDGALHHLAGTGNATSLGRFTYTADITVDDTTGTGVGRVTWTAPNNDQLFASTTGAVVNEAFPIITIMEAQIITGGTGRFTAASGTSILERSLNLLTGSTTGSFTGTITLSH